MLTQENQNFTEAIQQDVHEFLIVLLETASMDVKKLFSFTVLKILQIYKKLYCKENFTLKISHFSSKYFL